MEIILRYLCILAVALTVFSCNKINETETTALLPDTALTAITAAQSVIVTDINASTQTGSNKTIGEGYLLPVFESLKRYFEMLLDIRRGYFLNENLDDGMITKNFTYDLIRYDDDGNALTTITVSGTVTAEKVGEIYYYSITLTSASPAYYFKKDIVFDYANQKCKITVVDGVSLAAATSRAKIQLVLETIDSATYLFVLDVHKNFTDDDIRRNVMRVSMNGTNPVNLFALHKTGLTSFEFLDDIYDSPPSDNTWPSDASWSWNVKIDWTFGTGGTIYYGGPGGSSIVFTP